MAKAALVVCGNAYLAQRATAAGAARVEQLPTVIDLSRYTLQSRPQAVGNVQDPVPRIVWIGSPSTAKYLALLAEPLQVLAQTMPFVLRVVGAQFALPGVQVECVPWSEATEVADIAACDVGVMPLQDSAWERGKCGYKLIQYMACGLPVVASDVGVNGEIVQAGVNGYLARNNDEWLNALKALLSDAAVRHQFGLLGRQRVEDVYCIQKTGPVFAQWFAEAAGKS
jgi:glycosyltransferase involved in cell wall biosynthesis